MKTENQTTLTLHRPFITDILVELSTVHYPEDDDFEIRAEILETVYDFSDGTKQIVFYPGTFLVLSANEIDEAKKALNIT